MSALRALALAHANAVVRETTMERQVHFQSNDWK